jgi:putative acetyltransferase
MPTIRPEIPADVAAIGTIHGDAFGQPGEGKLVSALRAAGRLTISLVAEEAGRIVGHVAFSPVTMAGQTAGLGLAPLAVLPQFQRQGIGAALVRAGLAACERSGAGFVVVLGKPAYYGRFGFQRAANFVLEDEYSGGAAFQAIELMPGAIPAGGGLVRYAPEFALVAG